MQCFHAVVSTSCPVLQVLKVRQTLWGFILQPECDEEHFVDVDESLVNPELARSGSYEISARNPLYCKAEGCCLWELNRLGAHYHPSVQAFAKKLAAVSFKDESGDRDMSNKSTPVDCPRFSSDILKPPLKLRCGRSV